MNSRDVNNIAKSIVSICEKTTPGNVAHNMATIKHQALYLQTLCEEQTADVTVKYRPKYTPMFVKLTAADYIIETRKPLGLFYTYNLIDNVFTAIDNTGGDALTEDFASEVEVFVWLTTEREPVETVEDQKMVKFQIQHT